MPLRAFFHARAPSTSCRMVRPPAANKKTPRMREFSYWWSERGSNPRHEDFQSSALPTELSDHRFGLLYIIVFLKCLYFFCIIVHFFTYTLCLDIYGKSSFSRKYAHFKNLKNRKNSHFFALFCIKLIKNHTFLLFFCKNRI